MPPFDQIWQSISIFEGDSFYAILELGTNENRKKRLPGQ